jgi:hypothetical protein
MTALERVTAILDRARVAGGAILKALDGPAVHDDEVDHREQTPNRPSGHE